MSRGQKNDYKNVVKPAIDRFRKKSKQEGREKLEIIGVTKEDKAAFRKFKLDSGIEKNSDAFKRLLQRGRIS